MPDNGNQTKLQPTSGAAWRKPYEEGELVTLPSGKVARLGPVNLEKLIVILGKLPDSLSQVVADSLISGEAKELEVGSLKDLEGFVELANAVCEASFMEPLIVKEPKKDNEIAVGHVNLFDKIAVLERGLQGVQALEPFRPEQKVDVEPVDGRQPDEDAAK